VAGAQAGSTRKSRQPSTERDMSPAPPHISAMFTRHVGPAKVLRHPVAEKQRGATGPTVPVVPGEVEIQLAGRTRRSRATRRLGVNPAGFGSSWYISPGSRSARGVVRQSADFLNRPTTIQRQARAQVRGAKPGRALENCWGTNCSKAFDGASDLRGKEAAKIAKFSGERTASWPRPMSTR
jgi:hypothetical protein